MSIRPPELVMYFFQLTAIKFIILIKILQVYLIDDYTIKWECVKTDGDLSGLSALVCFAHNPSETVFNYSLSTHIKP